MLVVRKGVDFCPCWDGRPGGGAFFMGVLPPNIANSHFRHLLISVAGMAPLMIGARHGCTGAFVFPAGLDTIPVAGTWAGAHPARCLRPFWQSGRRGAGWACNRRLIPRRSCRGASPLNPDVGYPRRGWTRCDQQGVPPSAQGCRGTHLPTSRIRNEIKKSASG